MRQGSAGAATGDARSVPAYYEWSPPGQPLSIQISFAVIDQLEADVLRGFRSVPTRGAEVGGVLFGRVAASEDGTTVYVEDYEAVECEYRRGPSFVLSDADRRRLERTLRKGAAHRQIVGFYRSHTRLGLYMDQDDYALVQRYFPGPNQVFLLVRPNAGKSSAGGFFFWEEGSIRRQSTYLEFPFSHTEILKGRQGVKHDAAREAEAAAPAQPLPSAPMPVPVASAGLEPERVAGRAVRWLAAVPRPSTPVLARVRTVQWPRVGIAAAVLLCVVGLAYSLLKWFATPVPGVAEADYSPALHVERNGQYLEVNWNRNAPSIVNAKHAVLNITDGAHRRQLFLDPAQLRTGSVAYAPAGDDVSFRLEIVGATTTITESLRVVEGTARPAVQAAAPRPLVKPHTPALEKAPLPPQAVRAQARMPAKPPGRVRRQGWFDDGL